MNFVNRDDIKFHPKNPRKHSDFQIETIVKSISEFGWIDPILLSSDNFIIAGNGRVMAADR